MTGWGKKRPYRVSRVRMELNPLKATFNVDGENISVLHYYREKYKIELDPL